MASQGPQREEILDWCLPVIHDCLREFYVEYFPLRSAGFKLLSERHFALWSALIRGQFDAARADAAILEQKAAGLKLDAEICRAADRYIAAEILDLSLRRFRRMPRQAKENNMALLALLTQLQRHEAFAAAAPGFKRAA